jgi:hypothetical protein
VVQLVDLVRQRLEGRDVVGMHASRPGPGAESEHREDDHREARAHGSGAAVPSGAGRLSLRALVPGVGFVDEAGVTHRDSVGHRSATGRAARSTVADP